MAVWGRKKTTCDQTRSAHTDVVRGGPVSASAPSMPPVFDGRWFDFSGLHVEVSLGKILNPKLLLMCWSRQPPSSVHERMYEFL